jgi:hypothetical protein
MIVTTMIVTGMIVTGMMMAMIVAHCLYSFKKPSQRAGLAI